MKSFRIGLLLLAVLTVAFHAIASTPQKGKESKAIALHKRAIDMALKGREKAALKTLDSISMKDLSADERDRVWMTMGRVNYQARNFPQALEAYDKITAKSSSWFEALEERAWTYMQMGRPDDALAQLKTVLSPLFKDRPVSEPYFLTALAQLRICDYSALFKTIHEFKDRFRDRVKTWEMSSDPVAKARLKETSETIQKINLVEAEAIQRLYLEEDDKKRGGAPPPIAKSKGQMSFPHIEGDEVWLDEVDDFRVSVKECSQKGAKL